MFSSTYVAAGRPAPLKGGVPPRWGGCTLVQVNMCSVKVFQASDLVFVKRLRLTAGQQYSDAVNVLLRAKLAHDFAITSLAIVEKADSWVGHVFHLLGYVPDSTKLVSGCQPERLFTPHT